MLDPKRYTNFKVYRLDFRKHKEFPAKNREIFLKG
jgi:hypothetical protein